MTAPIRVAIVDDEALARRGVRARLARWADVAVVAEASDARSGIAAIVAHRPQLVFLDIEMPGADGFALLAELPPDVRPLVVFVTAHDDRAVEAFGVQALDYVLKPIDDERFARTIERARERLAHGAGVVQHLLVRDRGRIVVVDVDTIDWVQSEGDYVRLYAGRRTFLHLASLASIERELPAHTFLRVHRGALVNLARVQSLTHLTNGDYALLLATGARVRLSRRHRAAFMARFGRDA